MRRMREAGELGEILRVQGTYSQDWLLYDTDWNWRIDSKDNGPSRCMADIGSHWCDMVEHVTGLRITALCADLQTFHKTRKRPKGRHRDLRGQDAEAGRLRRSADRHGGFRRGGVPHGRPRARRLHGQPGVGGPQEQALHRKSTARRPACPGTRSGPTSCGSASATPNQIIIKDPSLLLPARASVRGPARRPQRRLRRHVQAGVPALLQNGGGPLGGGGVSAIRRRAAPAHNSGERTGELGQPRLGRSAPAAGCEGVAGSLPRHDSEAAEDRKRPNPHGSASVTDILAVTGNNPSPSRRDPFRMADYPPAASHATAPAASSAHASAWKEP